MFPTNFMVETVSHSTKMNDLDLVKSLYFPLLFFTLDSKIDQVQNVLIKNRTLIGPLLGQRQMERSKTGSKRTTT